MQVSRNYNSFAADRRSRFSGLFAAAATISYFQIRSSRELEHRHNGGSYRNTCRNSWQSTTCAHLLEPLEDISSGIGRAETTCYILE